MTTAVQDVFLQGKDGGAGLVLGVDHLVVENKIELVVMVFGSGHLLQGEEEVDSEEHQEKVEHLETAQNPGNHSYSRHLC